MMELPLSLRSRLLVCALIIIYLLPTVMHIYASQFVRPMADDYCNAVIFTRSGFWGYLDHFYQTWTGKYAYLALTALFASLPVSVFNWLPPLWISLWLAGLVWVVWGFFRLLHVQYAGYLALFFSALVAYAAFEGTTNVVQSVYWVSGAVTYFVPLIVLIFYTGFALTVLPLKLPIFVYWLAVMTAALLAFIGVGFSETYAVLQITLFVLAMLGVRYFVSVTERRRIWIWIGMSIVVSVVGLLIVMSAPGNDIRESRFPPPQPLPIVLANTTQITLAYIGVIAVKFKPIVLPLTFVMAAVFAYRFDFIRWFGRFPRGRVRRWLGLSAVVALGIVTICIAPSVYVMSTTPPSRVYLLPYLALVGLAICWGCTMAMGVRTNNSRHQLARGRAGWVIGALVLALAAAGPLATTWRLMGRAAQYQLFAQDWDARDRLVRAASERGEMRVEAPPFTIDLAAVGGLEDVGADINEGHNRCAADYYGIDALVVTDAAAEKE